MKTSVGILVTGALLIVPAALSSRAVGQEQNSGFVFPDWEFHGEVEAGWRAFIEGPPSGYGFGPTGVPLTAKQTDSRAKFEEYGAVEPGFYLEKLYFGGKAKDSSFGFDFWAKDVGNNNQNYLLELSRPGQDYLTFEWDQLPHLYSSSAKTLFDTSNPAALTVPDSLQSQLAAATVPNRPGIINDPNVLHPIELSVERDTGKVAYRWTPSPAWDFRLNYSDETRTGTMPFGSSINNNNAIQLPAPISFRTEDFSASGQYFGTYGDNKKFNINLAYGGSIFGDDISSFTWDNPFVLTNSSYPGFSNEGRNSLPPDNQAHRFTLTSGIDLPFDSRYMGTVEYGMMRQNDAFIPFTINPLLLCANPNSPPAKLPCNSIASLPATSLNGAIDTLLINNVLTTQLGNDLTSTLRYRYYDNNNSTPVLNFQNYVQQDYRLQTTALQNLPVSYIKQNASWDTNWRAQPWLTMGASYGWENYAWDRSAVNATDENSGKVFVDANPWDWLSLRASYLEARRRYDDYNALGLYGGSMSPLEQTYDLTNRDRSKLDLSAELTTPIHGLVITPTFSWRHDEFSDNLTTTGCYNLNCDLGLKDEKAETAGVEVAYAPSSRLTMFLSYMYEEAERAMVDRSSISPTPSPNPCSPLTSKCNWGSNIQDFIQTFSGSINIALVPDKINLELGYIYSPALSTTDTYALGSAGNTSIPQFPDVMNQFQQFQATLSCNFKSNYTAKLRYAYESNHMTNWAIDNMTPMIATTEAGSSLFLASVDPNYTTQILQLSLTGKF
jgi:MtrB/PioB family decaheme-associated outer membrane protein